MDAPFQPQVELNDLSPDVRAYIFQTLMEFEPFTTQQTTVAVIAKDPMKLAQDERYADLSKQELAKLWRISITLKEGDASLSGEGIASDIYMAIRYATDELLKQLNEIQDHIITNQDRMMQIQNALAGTQLH